MPNICKKCNSEFPFRFKIDGQVKNLCKRKYCLECSPWGSRNTSKLENLDKQHEIIDGIKIIRCKDCKNRKPKFKGFRCYDCWKVLWANKTNEKTLLFKNELVSLKGGCCTKCGYNKNFSALEFHHIDKNEKEFDISKYRGCKVNEHILQELEKCVLLCSNCHRKEHQLELTKFSNPTDNPQIYDIRLFNSTNATHSICGMCEKIKEKKSFYKEYNRTTNVCKSCQSLRVVIAQRKNKQEYVSLLGNACRVCGENNIAILEFHHKDASTKNFCIASKKFVKLKKEITNEIMKCELLCCNCHRELEDPHLHLQK